MNLDFSDDQKYLQEEARKFFDKEGGLSNARNVMDNSLELDQELWQKIVDLGWTGIRIPEAYEVLGLGHLELCVIAEELGRSLAPVPFSSSVYFFTEAQLAQTRRPRHRAARQMVPRPLPPVGPRERRPASCGWCRLCACG